MLNQDDLKQIKLSGMDPQTVEEQLNRHKQGYPFITIKSAATVGNGILKLDDNRQNQAIARWDKYLNDGGEVVKFQPASGAASRMFKALFAYIDNPQAPNAAADEVLRNIDKMPFKHQLDQTCQKLYGQSISQLIADGRGSEVISALIQPQGMNYGALPKALLMFHAYSNGEVRTPLEEQLAEGAAMARRADGSVHLHFTVSPQHRQLFLDKLAQTIPAMEQLTGAKFKVDLSEQKASTDTIAANPDGTPFREEGKLVFRPGGHGALIENLNDIDGEVVFIKNIDNVVPESQRADTIRYKKVLGGVLVEARDQIKAYLDTLATGTYTRADLDEMLHYLHTTLCVSDPNEPADDTALAAYLQAKFNRPLRVCGMVKNEGEPGGGPFIASAADGSFSPQILESHQIDPDNKHYTELAEGATHFNPVDLVCWIRNLSGEGSYKLTDYVDQNAGFISSKSLHGKELRALELPGLWNGAMSNWNTIFVEVPISTFNPVKTVNDLLRPTHQES